MRWIVLISILVALSGCKKAENRRCFKSAGAETTVVRELDAFSGLFVGPNVNIVLVQDGKNEVHISGGENLVNFISTDINDGVLTVLNENKCNFLRSYKHEITVEVHFTGMSYIEFEGTKPLMCQEEITGNNLSLIIRDGAGLVDLDLTYNNVNVTITNGWGNFDLSGTTGTLIMNIRNNGFGSTYDLNVTNTLDVISNTAGLLQLNTESADCKIQLQSTGDIWYVGTPNTLDATELGTGQLIDKN
ncbi:MAG: GIN domain-containing protein [Fluviicola sp.]